MAEKQLSGTLKDPIMPIIPGHVPTPELHGDRFVKDDKAIEAWPPLATCDACRSADTEKARPPSERSTGNFGMANPTYATARPQTGWRWLKNLAFRSLIPWSIRPVPTRVSKPKSGQAVAIAPIYIWDGSARSSIPLLYHRRRCIGGALGTGVGDRVFVGRIHGIRSFLRNPAQAFSGAAGSTRRKPQKHQTDGGSHVRFQTHWWIVKEPVGGAHSDPAAAVLMLQGPHPRSFTFSLV